MRRGQVTKIIRRWAKKECKKRGWYHASYAIHVSIYRVIYVIFDSRTDQEIDAWKQLAAVKEGSKWRLVNLVEAMYVFEERVDMDCYPFDGVHSEVNEMPVTIIPGATIIHSIEHIDTGK